MERLTANSPRSAPQAKIVPQFHYKVTFNQENKSTTQKNIVNKHVHQTNKIMN